jgi:hypothetical protein
MEKEFEIKKSIYYTKLDLIVINQLLLEINLLIVTDLKKNRFANANFNPNSLISKSLRDLCLHLHKEKDIPKLSFERIFPRGYTWKSGDIGDDVSKFISNKRLSPEGRREIIMKCWRPKIDWLLKLKGTIVEKM